MSFSVEDKRKAYVKKDSNMLFFWIILILLLFVFIIFTLVQALRVTTGFSGPAAASSVSPLPTPIEVEAPRLGYQLPPLPSSQELEECIVKTNEESRSHSEEIIKLKRQVKANSIRARMVLDEQKDETQAEPTQVVTSSTAMVTTKIKSEPFVKPKTPLPTREERKKMESKGIISF